MQAHVAALRRKKPPPVTPKLEEATAREAAERHAVLLGESVREPSGDRKVPVVAAEPRISRRSDHLD